MPEERLLAVIVSGGGHSSRSLRFERDGDLSRSALPRLCNRRVLIDKGLRLFGFNRLPTTGPVSATLIGCCFSILTPPVVLHLRVIPPRPPRLGRRRPPVSAQGRRVRRSQRAPQVHTYQSQSGTRRLLLSMENCTFYLLRTTFLGGFVITLNKFYLCAKPSL